MNVVEFGLNRRVEKDGKLKQGSQREESCVVEFVRVQYKNCSCTAFVIGVTIRREAPRARAPLLGQPRAIIV